MKVIEHGVNPMTPTFGGSSLPSNRVVFVDVTRSLVIFGSLLIHSLIVFGLWEATPLAIKGIGNGLFRICTPTFFLLFGVLLEWVSVARGQRNGAASVSWTLARRGFLCWIGLQLSLPCCLISGRVVGFDHASDCFLGLAEIPLSSVLRFYAFAMPLSIPIVLLRPRLGPWLPISLIAVIWVGAAAMHWYALPWPGANSRYAFLSGFLFGHPPVWVAGSLWHDMSIVFLGMALGYHMREQMSNGDSPLGGPFVKFLVAFCVLGIGYFAYTMGIQALAQGYFGTGMTLRSSAHPAYFLISTLSALGLIWLVHRLYPSTSQSRPNAAVTCLGRHSLLAFAVGNAGLNLISHQANRTSWLDIMLLVAYLSCWFLAIYFYDRRCLSGRVKASLIPHIPP